MLTSDRFTGVLAASLTPVDEKLAPNISLMAEHCKWLLSNGCDGLAILGTTGEANSFSVKEKSEIMQGLVERGIPGEKLLPGTGTCSIQDTIELTKISLDIGSRGALMLPPFYYKNPPDEGLYRYFSEIIQNIAEDSLKIYLYHFPQMSSIPFSFKLIERLTKNYPNTVVGMKDSSGDLQNMIGAVRNFDNFCVLAGADDLFLELLENGGGGCITACANVSSSLSAQVYLGHSQGKDVSEANKQLVAVRRSLSQFNLPGALKALNARRTKDETWKNVRPPLVIMEGENLQKLFATFDLIGYQIPE